MTGLRSDGNFHGCRHPDALDHGSGTNAADFEALVREAAGKGATYVQTPEMTGALVRDQETRRKMFRTNRTT